MRLPITPQVSTKDGTSNKNARLTNCLKEVKKSGEKAVIRPGLVLSDTYAGLGNGLIEFDGRLLVVYDDTVTDVEEDSFPWPLDSDPWGAAVLYNYGDAVWYLGNLWFSQTSGNVGNTPSSGAYWDRSYEIPDYDPSTSYSIGSPVSYGGVTYYSMGSSNTGNTPGSNPMWSTTSPTASRWTGTVSLAGWGGSSKIAGSAEAAGYAAWDSGVHKTCATDYSGSHIYYLYSHTSSGILYLDLWQNEPPYTCASTSYQVTVGAGTVIQTV